MGGWGEPKTMAPETQASLYEEEIRLLRLVVRAMFEGAQRSGATHLAFEGTSGDIGAMRDATNRALEATS